MLSKSFKTIVSGIAAVILLLSTVGCGGNVAEIAKYAPPEKMDVLKTQVVATNSNFNLIWNAQNKRVVLYDKIHDAEWSYTPQEALDTQYNADGESETNRPIIDSPIIVGYYELATIKAEVEINAFAKCIAKNRYTVELLEEGNGVRMTFYFDETLFAIPVDFILVDQGIEVSIDPKLIQEGDQYSISNIKIAPFFCSNKNANHENNDYYLFTPSGSGAIVKPLYREGLFGYETNEPIYGVDENIQKQELRNPLESGRIPVYGAVNGDRAICAIVEDGAESAKIYTKIGYDIVGYSYVCADFGLRGYQSVVQSLFSSTIVEAKLYADAFIDDKISVGFYPLYGEDASYSGMAEFYRNYLIKNGTLEDKKSDDSLLNLKIVGGIETTDFFFGVPYTTMYSTTTLSQAQSMIKDLNEKTGLKLNANLVGFGENGAYVGAVAGNAAISSEMGSSKDMKNLTSYCSTAGNNLFMNFDLIRFASSGAGASKKALTANDSYTDKYFYKVNFRTNDASTGIYHLLSRSELKGVLGEVKDSAASWNLTGLSLDSLTSLVYSDYSNVSYYAAGNCEEQFSNLIQSAKDDGLKIAGSDANAYAAALCDHIYDVPTQSSNFRMYDYDVPFYQLVFKGYVSMSNTSLNLATNSRTTLLKAVETGIGLSYTLINNYDTALLNAPQNLFYGSVYDDVKDDIVATVTDSKFSSYFESVKGASIVDHVIVSENLRKTVFDNGVSVYVNYGNKAEQTTDGSVAANDYLVVREG